MSFAWRPWLVAAAVSAIACAIVCTVASRKEEPGWSGPQVLRIPDGFEDWRPRVNADHIVTASVFSSEVLLPIAPPTRLAGVHYLAADPRYSMVADAAKAVRQVGAEPEQVLAAHPDLVITDEFTKAETQQLLERAGVAVRRTHPIHSFRDVADNIRMIGYVTGFPDAEDVIHQMHGRIYALKANAAAVGDWRVMTLDGALDTYGTGSLVDDVIRAAGAVNVAAEHGVGPYRKLDVESVLAWRPDAIIVSGDPATTEVPEWLRQTPGLSLLPCVQKKHIVNVPGALLGSTSHHVVGAAEMIQVQLRRWGKP